MIQQIHLAVQFLRILKSHARFLWELQLLQLLQKNMDYFPQDYDSNIVTEGNCPHGQEAYECPSELAQNWSKQPATPFGQLSLQSFKLYKIHEEPKSYSAPGQLKTLLFQLLAISVEATDFNKIYSIFQWQSLEVNIKSSTAC